VFIDGERVDGAQPEELLWTVIDRALRAAGEVRANAATGSGCRAGSADPALWRRKIG